MEAHGQIRIPQLRRDEGVGRRAALPAPVGELIEAHATLRRPVEIRVVGFAERLHGLHEPAGEIVDMPRVRDQQRTVGPVQVVGQAVVALHPPEMGQHVAPAPTQTVVAAPQRRIPRVVIGGTAAHVDLRVHRASAAQDVALRYVVYPAVEMVLRRGPVVPHEFGAVDHLEDARRHVQQRMPVRMPRLEKQDAGSALARQTGGGDAARRSSADDDVIERLHQESSTLNVTRTYCQAAPR